MTKQGGREVYIIGSLLLIGKKKTSVATKSPKEVWLNKRKCRSGQKPWELGLRHTTVLSLKH